MENKKKLHLLLLTFLLTLLSMSNGLRAQTAQEIINDMILPCDGCLHGTEGLSWGGQCASGAVDAGGVIPRQNNNGEWMQAMTAWGQTYIDCAGSPTTNTRVQYRNLITKFLRNNGTWELVQGPDIPGGAMYVENFANNENKGADIRDESNNGGGISVTVGVGINAGYNYHYYGSGRAFVDINNIQGVYTSVEARLILDNPNGIDDRAQSRTLNSMGADWWLNMTVGWLPDWSANFGIGGGRNKWVTTDWQTYNMCTRTVAQIRANPPIIGKDISIVKPADDTTFVAPAEIMLKAEADAGNDTVKKVEFYNGSEKIGETLAEPYTYTWSAVSKGQYIVTAVMIDSDADTITSYPVHITVLASHPPEVFISAPADNSIFPDNSDITISANASDIDGSIASVAFYSGDQKLGESISEPYNFVWTDVPSGMYTITAIATDDSDVSTTSLPIHIAVGDCNSGSNLISNPEFDDGTNGWKTWNDGGSAFTKSVVQNAGFSGDNALWVNITKASGLSGIRYWTRFDFKSGHTYRICFMAKAETKKKIKIGLKERALNGKEYWSQEVTVDTIANSYGPFIYHSDVDYTNGELDFYLGSDTSDIWLDKIIVVDQNATNINTVKLIKMHVYPNPVTGNTLYVDACDFNKEVEVKIFNMVGQKVFAESNIEPGILQIPVNKHTGKGIYLIRITSDNKSYVEKILVE